MIGTIKDYNIHPAKIHHNNIPTPNMILSVSMLPALTSVLLLVVLWPFKPWLSSFRMNAFAFTSSPCLVFYNRHSSSHYWFPPCSLMQAVSSTDRKNRTTHERPSALPALCHIYRIYSWLSYSCLLVYMIDSRISAQTAEHGEYIGEYSIALTVVVVLISQVLCLYHVQLLRNFSHYPRLSQRHTA